MGDKNRGREFARYIRRNFPNARAIFAIADGNLNLARELCGHYSITVIDPDIRNRNLAVKKVAKIVGKEFSADWRGKCDVIVGMHPDEATGEIIDYALRHNIPCSIVPCCKVGRYSHSCTSKKGWVKFIKNIFIQRGWQTRIDMLPISGDNLVVTAIPKPKEV